MPGKDFNSDLNEEDEEFMKELATIEKNMNKMDAGGKTSKSKSKGTKRSMDEFDFSEKDIDDADLLDELNELMGETSAGPSKTRKTEGSQPKRSAVREKESKAEKEEKKLQLREQRISLELSDPESDAEAFDGEEDEFAALMDKKQEDIKNTDPPVLPRRNLEEQTRPVVPEIKLPEVPPRAAAGGEPPVSSGSTVTTTTSGAENASGTAGDVKTEIRTILRRRLLAFTTNGLAAQNDGNMKYAAECAENVTLFQEAIKMVDQVDLTMADLDEVPKTPPPYRKRDIPKPAKLGERTFEEELLTRAIKFKQDAEDYQTKGDGARARMQLRNATQIEDAIRKLKRGGPVQPDKLPVPSGFSPLPATIPASLKPSPNPSVRPSPNPSAKPSPTPSADPSRQPSPVPPEPIPPPQPEKTEKELLEEKLQKFKKAALLAKKKGDLTAAANYMRASRATEKEIKELAHKQANTSASSEAAAQFVTAQSVSPPSFLLPDLKKQLDLVVRMRNKFELIKDNKHVQFYEQLKQKVRVDVELCLRAAKQGDEPIEFKMTELKLPNLEVNPGISPDVLELRITKIENLKLPDGWKPSDGATFVTYDFPFPHEAHQKGKTAVISGTDNPEFSDVFQLEINRKAKQLQRALTRYPLKLSVFQKGGFLRSDKPCGEATIVLNALDEHASFTDTRDLLFGRRKTGGTITYEVKIQKPLNEAKMLTMQSHSWVHLKQK